MLSRKIMTLSLIIVSLLAISAVSATNNVSEDIVSIDNDNEEISVYENATALTVYEPNNESVLKSNINTTVEVLSASNTTLTNQKEVLGAINHNSTNKEPILKSSNVKIVKMKIKYKWTTKKVGKYKIKARLWHMTSYAYGDYTYVDIILYKNGKQLRCSKYLSKYHYKENGKWKWWPKWRHGAVDHAYHRYANNVPINYIKVKFSY